MIGAWSLQHGWACQSILLCSKVEVWCKLWDTKPGVLSILELDMFTSMTIWGWRLHLIGVVPKTKHYFFSVGAALLTHLLWTANFILGGSLQNWTLQISHLEFLSLIAMPQNAVRRKPATRCCTRGQKKERIPPGAKPDSVVNRLKKSIQPYKGLSKMPSPAEVRRRIADKTEIGRSEKRRRLMAEPLSVPRQPGQTFLEQSAISPRTAADYKFRMEVFKKFCLLHWISTTGPRNLDPSLTTFLQQCFNDGMELAEATQYLAAVIDSCPEAAAKHKLPRARRALKGWKNLDPGRSRPPLPWPLIALIAQTMLEQGHMFSAMLALTMFVTYSRPTETLRLQKKDFLSSTSLAATWMLVFNREEEFETSKMGVADENISLDSRALPWLGKALEKMSKPLLPTQLLFQVEYSKFLTQWKGALQKIGLPEKHSTPYQLRHSGASWDRFKNFRTQLEVKMRGRWESDSSMSRYEKKALVATAFDSLPKSVQRKCHSAVQSLPGKVHAILGLWNIAEAMLWNFVVDQLVFRGHWGD